MLSFPVDWSRFQRVLCLGAHCDDIEIGCGGALLQLQARQPNLQFHWLVLSGDEVREAETRAAAAALLGPAEVCRVEVWRFRTSYLPYSGAEIKDCFEDLKDRLDPDLIFTHRLDDRHQDHRLIAELTWNTYRNHRVLEYEIPKFEGDLGRANLLMPLSQHVVDRKVEVLERCFPSQRQRPWFRPEVFRGLMRVRGLECNADSGYAEAFDARKLVL